MKAELIDKGIYPFVSVIVPVYNDAHRISKCIEALLNQSYPKNRYEIIVVDNGSTDETLNIIKEYPVKLLVENRVQSSYAARNIGIKNSKGDILAFTDSDCIPSFDWIEKGVSKIVETPNCGLVGGNIKIFFENKKPNAVELYDSIMGFNQKEDIEKRNFGSTANVFTLKSVIEKVGPFNDKLKSGGDNEWGRRVFLSGYKQIYSEEVIVYHPARKSIKELYKRYTRLIGGCYQQYWKGHYKAYFLELIKSTKNIFSIFLKIILDTNPFLELDGFKKKIQFYSVYTIVETICIYEKTRLFLGGRPRR